MKRILLTLVGITLGILSFAQGYVNVRGIVVDSEDKPIDEAMIVVVGTRLAFLTNADGTFDARIPSSVDFLQVRKAEYFTQTVGVAREVKVVLVVDEDAKKAAAEKAAAEAARLAAEKAAAEKAAAEAARLAAEKAAAEAAAKLAAEAKKPAPAAKPVSKKSEAEMAIEEAARIASEKAEEAKAAAEKAEIAAEKAAAEAARLADEKAAEAAAAAQRAEAERMAREAIARDKKARHGLQSMISVSYLPTTVTAYYQYASAQKVWPNPIQIDFTLNYRFSPYFALGASVGYMRFLKSLHYSNQTALDADGEAINEPFSAIPVCLTAKCCVGNGVVHPFISASGGIDFVSNEFVMDAGVGLEFRKEYRSGIQIMGGITKLPVFGTYVPKVKVGLMF